MSELHGKPVLVLGGTGKTGRRVAERLGNRDVPVRIGSRSAEPTFDWEKPATWGPTLDGVGAVYLSFQPDLAVPGADEAIRSFVALALEKRVRRVVLLSGRGEPEAETCEAVVMNSGADWTIVRASWFAQNFSEDFLSGLVLSGELTLPAGDVPEPFIDVDDIADVAVAALTEEGHVGQLYEVTGPRLLTFREAAQEIATASGRKLDYVEVPLEPFLAAMREQGVPDQVAGLVGYLFGTVLDGRNARVTDGVYRALGREAKDFSAFAQDAVTSGAWDVQAASAA